MKPGVRNQVKMFLTALAVGLLIVGVTVYLAFTHRLEWYTPAVRKWGRFAFDTGIFEWFIVHAYWKLRRSLGFWGIFAVFLAAHCLGVGYFFYVSDGLSLAGIVLAAMAEFACMGVVIYRVLGVGPSPAGITFGSVEKRQRQRRR